LDATRETLSVLGAGVVDDGLDVVAVGIADERPVVARVVLGPQPRRVQALSTGFHGRGVERADGGASAASNARCTSRLGPTPGKVPTQNDGLPCTP